MEDLVTATLADVYDFYERRYGPGNTVVSISGNTTAARAFDACGKAFGAWRNPKEETHVADFSEPLGSARKRHERVEGGAMQFLFAVTTPPLSELNCAALRILDQLLGGGRWSRLFSALKGQRGLVRSVSSLTSLYEDAGYLACYGTAAIASIDAIRQAVLAVWKSLREDISAEEVEDAKRAYVGALARNFETNLSIASAYGIEMLSDRLEPFRDTINNVFLTTRKNVLETARQILNTDVFIEIARGPGLKDESPE